MNSDIGRQMGGAETYENQPAMYSSQIEKVFPARWTSGSRMVLQVDLIVVDRIVEMLRADRIFGQEQRAMGGVPDGERPIPHELGEAVGAPFS